MKIKDQIRSRREQLEMEMGELARRVGVTEQAVRHWESGRSFPGKSKAHLVEDALSITLDWTEGVSRRETSTAASLINHADIELLVTLCKLPVGVKLLFAKLAQAYIDDVTTSVKPFAEEEKPRNVKPFVTESGSTSDTPDTKGSQNASGEKKTVPANPKQRRQVASTG